MRTESKVKYCHNLSGGDTADKGCDAGNEKEGMSNKTHMSIICFFFVLLMLCEWEKSVRVHFL